MARSKPLTGRRQRLAWRVRRSNERALDALMDENLDWFVGVVPPQKEFEAQQILATRGIISFVPIEQKWRRRNRYQRAKDQMDFPLVPGYLFIGFEPGAHRWRMMFDTRAVRGIVGLADKSYLVPTERMISFFADVGHFDKARQEERHMRSNGEFKIGDQVQIVEGPLAGQIVDVKSIKGRKAEVVLDLLGGPTQATIGLDALSKST